MGAKRERGGWWRKASGRLTRRLRSEGATEVWRGEVPEVRSGSMATPYHAPQAAKRNVATTSFVLRLGSCVLYHGCPKPRSECRAGGFGGGEVVSLRASQITRSEEGRKVAAAQPMVRSGRVAEGREDIRRKTQDIRLAPQAAKRGCGGKVSAAQPVVREAKVWQHRLTSFVLYNMPRSEWEGRSPLRPQGSSGAKGAVHRRRLLPRGRGGLRPSLARNRLANPCVVRSGFYRAVEPESRPYRAPQYALRIMALVGRFR